MLKPLGVLVLLAAMVAALPSASAAQVRPEIRPFAGAFVPTGPQTDQFKTSFVAGIQAGVEVADRMHVIGNLAYAPAKFEGGSHQHVDLYMADAGLEVFQIVKFAEDWEFRPFIGAGGGVRSYDSRQLEARAKGHVAGYGGAGGEIQLGRVSFRIEGRDYVTRGEMLGHVHATRNDLLFTGGGAFHW